MKLRKVKTDAEAFAAMEADTGDRPRVEFVSTDGQFSSVRIGQLHIGVGTYGSGIGLNREVPFDRDTRYKVTAKANGFEPQVSYFADYTDATTKRDSYGDGADVTLDSNVQVLVDEAGTVVRELGQGEDEIQF